MEKVKVAAFDLDGTVLDGESPLILTLKLIKQRQLKVRTGLRMGVWGIKYRLRLPQRESLPRELLFSALTNEPVEIVDQEIMEIYNRYISKRIRPGALLAIEKVKAEGLTPILASASFKPMTDAIVKELGFAGHVSTVMEEQNGHYTGRVVGQPVQGPEKLRQLQGYCDGRYGVGNWELARAYGDHFSDIPLLSAAKQAVVVDPDGKLERAARANGWPVEDWGEPAKG